MKPPTWPELAGALRRPRNRVLLGLLLLGLAVRIALPYVLRPLIVSQADAALVGRIALADLDLSLIRGGVTLHGLEVRVDELPAPAAPGAPRRRRSRPSSRRSGCGRRSAGSRCSRKTIDVEEFELEGFSVRLDRLKDGLLLPEARAERSAGRARAEAALRLVVRRRQRRAAGRADQLPRFHRRRASRSASIWP